MWSTKERVNWSFCIFFLINSLVIFNFNTIEYFLKKNSWSSCVFHAGLWPLAKARLLDQDPSFSSTYRWFMIQLCFMVFTLRKSLHLLLSLLIIRFRNVYINWIKGDLNLNFIRRNWIPRTLVFRFGSCLGKPQSRQNSFTNRDWLCRSFRDHTLKLRVYGGFHQIRP